MDGSAGFTNAITIVPYRILKFINSPDEIKEFYPFIKNWINYCLNVAKNKRPENEKLPEGIKEYILDTARHWGEWAEPGKMGKDYFKELEETGHAEIATAFLALDCLLASKLAESLGYGDDANKFIEIFEKAKNAYRYVYTDNGNITSSRQCHYVRPVAHNLLSEDEKQSVVNALTKMIKDNGTFINTGFLTTCHLCNVLTDYGHADIAYDLLLNRDQPSWLYEVEHGATTIWESWFGIKPDGEILNSHNHYSLGAIAGWMMSRVLGIVVQNGEIIIKPYVDARLGYAKGSFLSIYGEICSEWRYKDKEIEFKIVIPVNKTASFILPNGETKLLESGKHTFTHYI
jgi:alpha-L-rhamnosidase